MRILAAAFALIALCNAASAETWYYDVNKGEYKSAALSDPSYWKNDTGSCSAFSAEDDYVISGWKFVWTQVGQDAAAYHFYGKSLSIGEIGGDGGVLEVRVYDSDVSLTFDNDGLFLDKGVLTGYLGWHNRSGLLYGKVTVRAPESHPFHIVSGGSPNAYFTNKTLVCNGPLISDQGKCLVVGENNPEFMEYYGSISGNNAEGKLLYANLPATNFTFKILGECDKFMGTLKVSGRRHKDAVSFDTQVNIGTASKFAGTVIVTSNGILGTEQTTDTVEINSLSLQADATLNLLADKDKNTVSSFTVAKEFSHEGPFNIAINVADLPLPKKGSEYPVLFLPETAE